MIFRCGGCRSRDGVIDVLRHQLDEALRTALALADARAYALRYPRDAPKVEVLPSSPADFRRRQEPALSSEEVEAMFARQAEDAQAVAGATAPAAAGTGTWTPVIMPRNPGGTRG